MKVFRDLEIYGEHSLLEQFISEVEGILNNGWWRNVDREQEIHTVSLERMYCFTCNSSGERNAGELWMNFRNDSNLYVSNIIPQEIDLLTYDQFNLIIEEFCDCFSLPVANNLGLDILLTSDEKRLEDWMSEETAIKLKNFSNTANKATGSSHPSDQERWFDFIVSIHNERTNFDSNILSRWLIEDGDWSSEIVNRLTEEFEFAVSLLSFYDEN